MSRIFNVCLLIAAVFAFSLNFLLWIGPERIFGPHCPGPYPLSVGSWFDCGPEPRK